MRSIVDVTLAVIVFHGVCLEDSTGELRSSRLSQSISPSLNSFVRLASDQTGLDFSNRLHENNLQSYLYIGAGGCAGDFDGDGLTDLFLISQDGQNKLWKQSSPWQFEDFTVKAGDLGGGDSFGTGSIFVDIDNDGDLDLHVGVFGGPDQLFINRGDGTFDEAAESWNLAHESPTVMATFSDYDRDGDLDCYLVSYRLEKLGDLENAKIRMVDEEMKAHPDFVSEYDFLDNHVVELGRADHLMRNDGGVFKEVSGPAGLSGDLAMALSATWYDYNNDSWPDLYVANDFYHPDRLWRNNGDGTFSDVLPGMTTVTPWFSMGSDFADVNRDGWFDFLGTDMSAMTHYRQKMEMGEMGRSAWFLEYPEPRQYMRNMLYINAGSRRFLESGQLSGLSSTGWTWSARFADLDCDGWEDAIFTNGMIRDLNNADLALQLRKLTEEGKTEERKKLFGEFKKSAEDHNKVFRNLGDLRFEDASEAWNYNDISASYGLILADLDNDGDLDAVTCNMNEPVGVYRNDISTGNRVTIELRGRQSNTFGVGARLRLKSESGWQTRMLTLARGYESGCEPVVHFGLGDDESIERLEISWPGGAKQVLENLPVNHRHTITEPEGAFSTEPARKLPVSHPALFSQADLAGFDFVHKEDNYDDFENEPLLPWKLSRLGPGIAFGDADADGDEDIWVGGATGQAGRLLTRNEEGTWDSVLWKAWERDSASEDMGAVFFDPDHDGDLDLYVASGGNQTTLDEIAILEDRLYLNVETPGEIGPIRGFAKANSDPDENNRARESSGVVAAADYDGDGDVDLFVGSRLKPGHIHETPPQRLLRNEGDRFVDVIGEVAPALRDCGMITGAIWTDVDNDGRLDLLVTTAWGAIRVFKQSGGGNFNDFTEASGLSDAHGWWQGIAGGDLDGDGDIDYVATNLGTNTKYHASPEHPIQVYLNDFDGDGDFDLVESEFEGDILYPMRGRSCSSQAMPFITKKFKSYHDFATAELSAIYTEPKLKESRILKFTHLESTALINDGEGRFELKSLPTLAQIAPAFGICIEDFDGDGKLDATLAQNFYSPQSETGRMSGGLGAFLKGNGDGTFKEVWPQDSGIFIYEDAKSLAVGDLNDDGAPDLVCGVNNGSVKALVNQTGGTSVRWTSIRLDGAPGNPTAIGSRLEITTNHGRKLIREISGGGSYLSQSSPKQFVALARDEQIDAIQIRWPRGRDTNHRFEQFDPVLVIAE